MFGVWAPVGLLGVVLARHGHAEDAHHRIADELVHVAAVLLDLPRGDVEVLVVLGVVAWDCKDLVVWLAAVEHLEHADRPDIDLAAGEGRLVDSHEDVERIAVLAQGRREETDAGLNGKELRVVRRSGPLRARKLVTAGARAFKADK